MRAVRVHQFGGPEVLTLEDTPDPKAGAGEVVVRVRAAGINPVDTYIPTGSYAFKPPLPYTPGFDGAGEIESLGPDVTTFAPGDRVYVAGPGKSPAGAGTYAERALCSLAQLHPLPARVTFAQGAALGVPYCTAFRALFQRTDARAGDTVLVHGATGGVGLAAVQLAHARGIRVIGTGGTEKGMAIVREQGAEVVVNHRAPGYADEIKRATGGRGVDVIIEMATHLNLDRDLGLLAKHGRVVVVGNRGRTEIDARQAMGRDAAILGMTLFNVDARDMAEIHGGLSAGLSNGTLNPIIGRELPLAEVAAAHRLVMEGGTPGKVILVP